MAQDDKRLSEILQTARKYRGETYWEDYLGNHFARLSMTQRADELARWDDLIEAEVGPTTIPTREHADLVQRKRQLEDLHYGLLRVDR
jgi:hypothetical protein